MSDGGIELDDVQVVEVTGKAHRDKQRRSRRGGCHWNPSLRATTILIFIVIGIIYVVGVALGNILMFNSLEVLDRGSSNTSINRLAMLIEDDMVKLKQMVFNYAFSDFTVAAVQELLANPGLNELQQEALPAMYAFMTQYLNNTMEIDEHGIPSMVFNTASETNYWAILDTKFNVLWDAYFPQEPGSPVVCSKNRVHPPPFVKPSTYEAIHKESDQPLANSGMLKLLIPDGPEKPTDKDVFEPFIISLEPIAYNNNNSEVFGFLIAGRSLNPRMKLFSDDVPTCITIQNGPKDPLAGDKWDAEDRKYFSEVVEGTFGINKTYGGTPVFAKRENTTINGTVGRICPSVPLFNSTSSLMVGYINLCGMDPAKYGKEHASCTLMRLDRPMSMVEQGTYPVIYLSLEIIGMMIVLCIIFVIFLDCVVLRRIVNLSNVIKKQTRGHAAALKDEDETTATASAAHDDKVAEKHGKTGKSSKAKSGRSASGTSENSRTTNSSDAGAGGGSRPTSRDEIGNLKRAMEQNALGLRKRLEAVNDSIKIEQQKTIRHKQAMQLLNLWCGRKDYFPGLRPNAMQLRYEPTRNLDDLLSNPLAIEYLKSHCESDRTLENLWFILDVSWLEELETAEDNEEDAEKKSQIHDVSVCAAKTILQRYIAVNAPQQINISAGTYKKLREKGETYTRHMFDDAVSEVKLMLNTDILPRFQKSAAYSAMSETLFIDSSGDGDESEFSDETVSTAGSILTDEAEEGEGGVAHVFAHTFKNLHTAFEVGHDDNSSSYSASSSHATTTSGVIQSGTLTSNTANTGAAGQEKGSKEESSIQSSEPEPPKLEDEPKKEEPKKEEPKKEEPKKEEPKKEEEKKNSEGSSDSSDSSSHSISTDSMSESSSAASSSSGSD